MFSAELMEARIVTRGATQEAALEALQETLRLRLSHHLETEVEATAIRIVPCDCRFFEVEAPALGSLIGKKTLVGERR